MRLLRNSGCTITLIVSALFAAAIWWLPVRSAGVTAIAALGTCFFVMVAYAIWKSSSVTLDDRGVRIRTGVFFEQMIPYDAIVETRVVPGIAGYSISLLGFRGKELGRVSLGPRGHSFTEDLMRSLGPRRRPDALAALGCKDGERDSTWRARLDERARSLGREGYRVSCETEIAALADAARSAELALDVRAGAAYVLARARADGAREAKARALAGDVPPLVLAMVRAADAGARDDHDAATHVRVEVRDPEKAEPSPPRKADATDAQDDEGQTSDENADALTGQKQRKSAQS